MFILKDESNFDDFSYVSCYEGVVKYGVSGSVDVEFLWVSRYGLVGDKDDEVRDEVVFGVVIVIMIKLYISEVCVLLDDVYGSVLLVVFDLVCFLLVFSKGVDIVLSCDDCVVVKFLWLVGLLKLYLFN